MTNAAHLSGEPRSLNGLVACGTHVPFNRILRSTMAEALGRAPGRGARAVASHDEDTTTMGVAAGQAALSAVPAAAAPRRLLFATSTPTYLDKTNATVVHAALSLDDDVLAVDALGSVRSGVGAILAAVEAPVSTLVVLSDLRTGLPGGSDERDGGDAAAALLFGPGSDAAPVLAEVLGVGSVTAEILDRWRVPGEPTSRTWEERFGESAYLPLAQQALDDALKAAGHTPVDLDALIVAGLHTRANRAFAVRSGVPPERLAEDFASSVGNVGAAQPGLALARTLETAGPGELIALVVIADGAAAFVLRTTPAIGSSRQRSLVDQQVANGRAGLGYATFLSWRGLLRPEPPRRPEPLAPAAPPSFRNASFKYGFSGTRCEACATVQLPPARVCVSCGAVDAMQEVPMANAVGRVVTYTVDHLAYSPDPPTVAAVVDFDHGGRISCQLTDVDPGDVAVGDVVEMTFRCSAATDGVTNYFWKARPTGCATTGGEV